ncbi:MAG TPA: AmmeMemoRadiSam system protein A [Burkholderiales bacterium]|nr:AmmeMemoRadiSam system protein A [Burkholderiales bacterium]
MPGNSDPIVLHAVSGTVTLRQSSAPAALPPDAGRVLLALARRAIATELGLSHPEHARPSWLEQHGACFITLTSGGRLRGCVGTLRAHRALGEDVRENAIAAAFRDPRFKPLVQEEFFTVALEISVLSALEPLAFASEREALAQLRPGVDGLVFEYGHHASTFLPQVWEDLKEPADFLAHLKYKAGLPPDFWDEEVKLSRYTVTKWRETDPS